VFYSREVAMSMLNDIDMATHYLPFRSAGWETTVGITKQQAVENRGDPLAERIDCYLSPGHRADVEHGCPNASFAGDARRLDRTAAARRQAS
jgi:hypothetical protein